jgi:pyridoxine 4-dehydrogenase
MVQAGQASIGRMGRVDLAQMHWPTANYAPWQEGALLDGLADLYEQGLIKGVGLSNYGPKRLKWVQARFKSRGLPIVSLQVQYSLLSTYPVTELGLKDICDEFGIKLIAYSPLCLGLLTGKYNPQSPFPKGLRRLVFPRLLPGITGLLTCLKEIAALHDKTIAQVALNWCIAKGTIPIPGAKTLAQADQNLGAIGWQLSESEVVALDWEAAGVDRKMVQNIFQTR